MHIALSRSNSFRVKLSDSARLLTCSGRLHFQPLTAIVFGARCFHHLNKRGNGAPPHSKGWVVRGAGRGVGFLIGWEPSLIKSVERARSMQRERATGWGACFILFHSMCQIMRGCPRPRPGCVGLSSRVPVPVRTHVPIYVRDQTANEPGEGGGGWILV